MTRACRRPDDADGSLFQRILSWLRERSASRTGASNRMVDFKDVRWVTLPCSRGTPAEKEFRADVAVFRLTVTQVSRAFLATEPLEMPRISWSLYCEGGEDGEEIEVGSAAPSVEIGMARAEAALRAISGRRLDA